MIFPAVIEESDAAVEGFVDQGDGGGFIFGGAEMVAAHAERGDFYAFMFAELAQRNGGIGCGLIRPGDFGGWFARRFHDSSLRELAKRVTTYLQVMKLRARFGGRKDKNKPCAQFFMNSPIRFLWTDQRAGLFLVAVVLGVALGRFIGVVHGLGLVTLSNLRVVCCFFVIAGFVVLGGLLMMFLRVARMFGRARVMLCGLLCHFISP